MKSLLELKRVSVTADDKRIVRDLSLTIRPGELHVLMGPNGSGKSSLAYALMGHPGYRISSGSATFANTSLRKLSPDRRAKLGLFLAFQYPLAIPGVSLTTLLPEITHQREKHPLPKQQHLTLASAMARERREKLTALQKDIASLLRTLSLPDEMLHRGLNDGFSGGEKKKAEIIQLYAAHPKLAILDEPDSGLDVDGLRTIATVLNDAHRGGTALLLITHYARILKYLSPDAVHILNKGILVRTGKAALAHAIEAKGYEPFLAKR